ncbi:MAG TPA: zinc ribbon domain-containing protein, partial [Ktedonobacteraceae bacterium]
MQHCENCASELSATARFCRNCGQRTGNETEVTTNVSDAPIEDLPVSSLATSTTFSELQGSTSENDVEEEEPIPQLAAENDIENAVEEKEPIPQLTQENDVEEEEQLDNLGSTSSTPRDLDAETEVPASQFLDAHSQLNQMPSGKLEALSPRVSTQGAKPRSRSIPKLLLILLSVLIVTAGVAAALIELFPGNLPGTRGAANALSSSYDSELVNTVGPSLDASICASSSTPGTSGGISLTLTTTSGCSSFNSAIATSLCLIFPYNPGAFHRYILDVSNVTVDSKPYHLVLSLAQYTGATTYNDALHITVGIGEGSSGPDFAWMYHSGNVTIN